MAWRLYQPMSERARGRGRPTDPSHAGPSPGAVSGARPSPRVERRGVALIMVLVITTIVSAISADLANEAKVNVRAAANTRDQLQAYFHARSAVELELFVLRFQGQLKSVLSFLPIPLFELSGFLVSSDTMKGLITTRKESPTDEKKKDTFALDKPFGNFEGSFWIEEVVDENRKININLESPTACTNFMHTLLAAMMDDPKYDPLFETIGDSRDPIRNRLEIIANITDWVDGNDTIDTVCTLTGDQSSGGTSEDSRYDHLPYNARYKPKNGQMTSLAELRMVPGVNDAFMRIFGPFLTVWSDKKGISMQTADKQMLRAVIRAISVGPPTAGDEEKFKKFLEEKSILGVMSGGKLDKSTFETLLSTAKISYDPARLNDLVTKEVLRFEQISSVYRITAVGRVNDTTSTITLVWRDDGTFGETFYWREE